MDKETKPQDMASIKRRYMLEIDQYERKFSSWGKRGDKIVARYRDERASAEAKSSRYNILWSNVQTIQPAVFANLPKPEVTRRYKDKDPVARVASILLERCLQYEVEMYSDYASAMENSIQDRLLPGRGMAWVRYEPKMKEVSLPGMRAAQEEVQITEDVEAEERQTTAEVIDYECCPVDYVHWKDFGHNIAPTWEEVYLVWRRVPLDRKELVERFGKEIGNQIPLDQKFMMEDGAVTTPESEAMQKAMIYELWDKKRGIVIWLSKGHEEALDVKDDPLQLDCFFPCPKPLYSTTTTGSLIPVPDYAQYQDQADELDLLCTRIDGLIQALKVVGVYDATQTGIQRMLNEGVANNLIPVDTWSMFAEKGGIKGVIDWLPLDMVVQALNAAYLARDQVKAVIYEVTGISDIIRGASNPNETLGAQQMKGQFASMRLKDLQKDVANFATTILQIKAQIICQLYQPETIAMMAGAQQMSQEDQQLVGPAIELLRNDPMRGFRIEISSDSLLEIDEQMEKQNRMELITTLSGFMREAVQAPPQMIPVIGEMALFAVRSFKAGKTLEGVLETAMEQFAQQAAQPKPPKPDPEIEKIKAQQQIEQQKLQGEMQAEAMRNQMEAQRMQQQMVMEEQMAQQKMQIEQSMAAQQASLEDAFARWKAELEAATKIEVANIGSQAKMIDPATTSAMQEIDQQLGE